MASTLLLVGASRGLGLALAAEFAARGWHVTGTVRGDDRTPLHDLADRHFRQVDVEQVDITDRDQIAALHRRLASRRFDIVFVNAGTANADQNETIAETSTEEFVRVMVTNALSVMRAVEALGDLVADDGVLGAMSSGQGSIANSETGGNEVYRGSKAALNQYMRSYAARRADARRALVLIAPGWIRTQLGGPDAPLTIADSIPKVADVLMAQRGRRGLRFLDRNGETVPW